MKPEKSDRAEEFIQAHYIRCATVPIVWWISARDLKHAADRLYEIYAAAHKRNMERFAAERKDTLPMPGTVGPSRRLEGEELQDFYDSNLDMVYFMLMGYVFENLLKGILMAQHPEYFTLASKLVKISTHDLTRLCKQCNVELEKSEALLLENLTSYIVWRGKYPIPLTLDDMPREADISNRELAKTHQEANKLYTKISEELIRYEYIRLPRRVQNEP